MVRSFRQVTWATDPKGSTNARSRSPFVLASAVLAMMLGLAGPAGAQPAQLPTPQDGYGRYHLIFNLGGTPRYRAIDILPSINTDFDRWFPYRGCGKRIAVGTVCTLDTPFGTAPVKVIALTDDGFALRSLPGHFEGPDRIIRFTFYTADMIGHLTHKTMHVDAWGPVSGMSLGGPLNGPGASVAAWQPFADTINSELPKEPLAMSGVV